MDHALDAISQTLADTLRFDCQAAAVTVMEYPHSTGWRVLPCIATAQILDGEHRIDLVNDLSRFLGPGDAMCIPPGVAHRSEKVSRTPSTSRWSHFNLSVLGSVDLCSLLDIPEVFRGRAARRMGDINEEMECMMRAGSPSLQQLITLKALGLSMAAIIVQESRPRHSSSAFLVYAGRLAPVLTLMHDCPEMDLSREELAAHMSLSPSRFYAVFKAAIGVSPGQYLQNLRLQRAQQLLIRTDVPIELLANKVGYPDSFHFSRLFKSRFGMSPSQYRRSVRLGLGSG